MDEGDTKQAKPAKTRQDRIHGSLKRARKLAGRSFDENPEQVRYMLEEARVLATLEVASALRGELQATDAD